MHPQNPPQKPWLTGYLLPLGSILIAALTFLTQNVQLPKWAVILAVLYLVLVAVVTLYGPVVRFFSVVSSRQRLTQLAKSTVPRLIETIKQFRQLVAQGQSNTLLYVLQEAAQVNELRNQGLTFDSEHVETIRTWLVSIERRIERYRQNDFSNLCRELSNLIHQYNRFCSQRLRALQEAMACGQLPEQRLRYLKQQWNVQREGHALFIRGWADLSKRINEIAGRQLCADYYEPLGTLE